MNALIIGLLFFILADTAPFAHAKLEPERFTPEVMKNTHRLYTWIGAAFVIAGFIEAWRR